MKLVRKVLTNPESVKLFYEIFHSDLTEIRHRAIPFSFMVVDNKACCFEVINPAVDDFFAAIRFDNNPDISKRLIESFHNLWTGAVKDPLTELSEDLIKEIEKQ